MASNVAQISGTAGANEVCKKRQVQDGLSLRPPLVELKTSGFFGDVRRMARLPEPNMPIYRHLKPRVPASILTAVLGSPAVKHAMADAAQQRNQPLAQIQGEAQHILEAMGHTMGNNYLRFTAYVMHKALVQIYEQVCVDPSELQMISDVLPQTPVLLLPTHRSYMDFIIISYLFFLSGVPVPAIAAGQDFMNMGIATGLLRGCGAFFIRRTLGDDSLYAVILSQYLQTIVTNGDSPLEFFIEGTRSRTGKSLHPKMGLLSMSLKPFFACKTHDITIFPISVTYEERMESHLYVHEMLGTPKPKESFGALLKARQVVTHNHGRMHLKICPPISVRKFCQGRPGLDRQSDTRNTDFMSSGVHRAAVKDLAYEVVQSHQAHLVITVPSMLSAMAIHYALECKSLVSRHQMIDDVCWLAEQIYSRQYPTDLLPRTHTQDVGGLQSHQRTEALCIGLNDWLGPLLPAVTIRGDSLLLHNGPEDDPFNSILLAHLRNELLHVFVAESLVLMSLTPLAEKKAAVTSSAKLLFRNLHSVLNRELLLRCDSVADQDALFSATLNRMVASGLLIRSTDHTVTLCTSPANVRLASFLRLLLAPFLSTYASVLAFWVDPAHTAMQRPLPELLTQLRAFNASQVRLSREALSADTLGNAIRDLADKGFLEKKRLDTGEVYCLSTRHSQMRPALQQLHHHITSVLPGCPTANLGSHL